VGLYEGKDNIKDPPRRGEKISGRPRVEIKSTKVYVHRGSGTQASIGKQRRQQRAPLGGKKKSLVKEGLCAEEKRGMKPRGHHGGANIYSKEK